MKLSILKLSSSILLAALLSPLSACDDDVITNYEKRIFVNNCSEDMIFTGAFLDNREQNVPHDTIRKSSYFLPVGGQASQTYGLGENPDDFVGIPLMKEQNFVYSFEFKDSIVVTGLICKDGYAYAIFDTWYDNETNQKLGTIVSESRNADTAIFTYRFTDEYIRILIQRNQTVIRKN